MAYLMNQSLIYSAVQLEMNECICRNLEHKELVFFGNKYTIFLLQMYF